MKYFEDFEVGASFRFDQGYLLTRENIIAFCKEWDPMPFHIDEEAARQSPMGRLFTSSAHLVAIALKLGHAAFTEPTAAVAGLGWDDVRFYSPGVVGDTLYLHSSTLNKRVSASNPERGIITNRMELVNQDDKPVAGYSVSTLVLLRPQ